MEQNINPKDVIIPEDIREKWQKIVNILMKIMGVPVALIMRVDYPNFEVFQSSNSPENPFKQGQEFKLPAGIYCEKTMKTKEMNLIPNALKDPEWDKNPSIAAGMIAYLGFPIFYPDKNVFGTICTLDKKENVFSKDFEDLLRQFKDVIESHLELLWQKSVLQQKMEELGTINKMCIDRESRILELKEQIKKLEAELKEARL